MLRVRTPYWSRWLSVIPYSFPYLSHICRYSNIARQLKSLPCRQSLAFAQRSGRSLPAARKGAFRKRTSHYSRCSRTGREGWRALEAGPSNSLADCRVRVYGRLDLVSAQRGTLSDEAVKASEGLGVVGRRAEPGTRGVISANTASDIISDVYGRRVRGARLTRTRTARGNNLQCRIVECQN